MPWQSRTWVTCGHLTQMLVIDPLKTGDYSRTHHNYHPISALCLLTQAAYLQSTAGHQTVYLRILGWKVPITNDDDWPRLCNNVTCIQLAGPSYLQSTHRTPDNLLISPGLASIWYCCSATTIGRGRDTWYSVSPRVYLWDEACQLQWPVASVHPAQLSRTHVPTMWPLQSWLGYFWPAAATQAQPRLSCLQKLQLLILKLSPFSLPRWSGLGSAAAGQLETCAAVALFTPWGEGRCSSLHCTDILLL